MSRSPVKQGPGLPFTHGVGNRLPMITSKGDSLIVALGVIPIRQAIDQPTTYQFPLLLLLVCFSTFCLVIQPAQKTVCDKECEISAQYLCRQSFCVTLDVKGIPLSLSTATGIAYLGIIFKPRL